MGTNLDDQGQGRSYSARERLDVVTAIARGEMDVEQASDKLGVRAPTLQIWVDEVLSTAKSELDDRIRRAFGRTQAGPDGEQKTQFAGHLDDLAPTELVQMLNMNGNSAKIVIITPTETHRVWLRDGEVVAARSGVLVGELALYRILSQRRGRFAVQFGLFDPDVCDEQHLASPTKTLLIEGACRADETERLLLKLPPTIAVLVSFGATPPGLTEEQQAVLKMFRPAATIQEVLMASELGRLVTLQSILDLWDRGDLETNGCVRTIDVEPSDDSLAAMRSVLGSSLALTDGEGEEDGGVEEDSESKPENDAWGTWSGRGRIDKEEDSGKWGSGEGPGVYDLLEEITKDEPPPRALIGRASGGIIGAALAATMGILVFVHVDKSYADAVQTVRSVRVLPPAQSSQRKFPLGNGALADPTPLSDEPLADDPARPGAIKKASKRKRGARSRKRSRGSKPKNGPSPEPDPQEAELPSVSVEPGDEGSGTGAQTPPADPAVERESLPRLVLGQARQCALRYGGRSGDKILIRLAPDPGHAGRLQAEVSGDRVSDATEACIDEIMRGAKIPAGARSSGHYIWL